MRILNRLVFGLLFVSVFVVSRCGSESSSTNDGGADASVQDVTVEATPEPVSDNPLDNVGDVEKVSGDFVFSEGPLWDSKNNVLYLSDILTNKIYILTPPSSLKVFREPTNFSNGLAFDTQGRLLAAERSTRRISVTQSDGTIETLAGTFDGKKFHGPNDLTVRKDGSVYFTDPPYAVTGEKELTFNGVFRIAPDKSITALWKGEDASRPNGIILSPDEARLYFVDAAAGVLYVGDVASDGSVASFTKLADTAKTPDGMTSDVRENLYIATQEGIQVFKKDGTVWGTIKVPEQPTNCTFGDEGRTTLYITARSGLYKVTNLPFAGSH